MPRVKIISPGKVKEPWLELALKEYVKRLRSTLEIEFVWTKDDAQLIRLVEKEGRVICLDAAGDAMDSEGFSVFLQRELELSGSRVVFVIGGADGLPPGFKERYPLVSLSRLTLTHQCARLILIEQIYRACEIQKGSSYHK